VALGAGLRGGEERSGTVEGRPRNKLGPGNELTSVRVLGGGEFFECRERIMIRLKTSLTALALASVAAAGGLAKEPAATTSAGETHEIQMTAKKYEFNPNPITVKKGEHVKLVITALDRDHGFKLDAFMVNQKLKKGKAITVEFTAARAGTFTSQCSDFCGLGHKRMKGKLTVEEQ